MTAPPSDAAFPSTGTPAERLRFALGYAVLAPSSHNSQPWLFEVGGDELRLYADRTRALPVTDPHDRELVISCGCALFHLRLALRRFGHEPKVDVLPDPGESDLLARVRLDRPHEPLVDESRMFDAIPDRRTDRTPFQDRRVPGWLLTELIAAAHAERAWLHEVHGVAREPVAELIAEADRLQFHDPTFRRELAAWIHPNRTATRDGMPGTAQGLAALKSYIGPLVVRTFDLGNGRAAYDRELAAGSPALVVLGTAGDHPADWMAAGQALARVLLRAWVDGVHASFLCQAIEVPELRPRLTALTHRWPQILLRLGYGHEDIAPTQRRAVGEVLRRPQEEPRS